MYILGIGWFCKLISGKAGFILHILRLLMDNPRHYLKSLYIDIHTLDQYILYINQFTYMGIMSLRSMPIAQPIPNQLYVCT